jgi:hypothetical protein
MLDYDTTCHSVTVSYKTSVIYCFFYFGRINLIKTNYEII